MKSDEELEQQAQAMAEKTLEKLPEVARAAQLGKVKEKILARLKGQQSKAGGGTSVEKPPPPDPASTPPPPPPPVPGSMSSTMRDKFLDLHNVYRCMHGAGSLVWDEDIARNAQKWANRGKYQLAPTSALYVRGYLMGQNVGMSRAGMDPSRVVAMWYAEVQRTNNGRVSNSNTRGMRAYSQVTWRATKRVGCGIGPGHIVVCHYAPAGAVAGGFERNTYPRVSSESTCTAKVKAAPKPRKTRMVAMYCGKPYRPR
eukprot:gnl/MRDRNA2_/MRDRNA2_144777_c0_seq1.p1 gnl/MRDRNA2_/MRDRNA2_144777_c0~~gnl/MRDRNA2_/MRDRNA2_144777_c0_seq1.p1  ORF type:complete len:256 (-),score=46.35 gnl/MRDRNA2_/MRDRNA2_144777_c0_seq1:35-802(-)